MAGGSATSYLELNLSKCPRAKASPRPNSGYERLPETLAGLRQLALTVLMLKNIAEVLA